jgi:hyperosmotically inducible protein
MRAHVAAVIGLFALTTACAGTDAGVTSKIKSQFASDDLVKARNIDVDTKEGVVTLTGTVGSREEESKALSIARGTKGVSQVVDNISVNASGEPNAAPTSGRVGETPAEPGGRLGGDASITAEVKTKLLADPMVRGFSIDVDTSNQVVTLTGTVTNEAEKMRAMEIARGVENVQRVEDKMTVGKP